MFDEIRSALQRIWQLLLGRYKSPGLVSKMSIGGDLFSDCHYSPQEIDLMLESHFKSAENTSSITSRREEAAARRRGPERSMAGLKDRHVPAHYSIGCRSSKSCNPSPVVVVITDTRSNAFKIRQMVNLDDALIWLVLDYDLPDGQIHDLADLGRAWYDGKLFEIKE